MFALRGRAVAVSSGIFCLLDLRSEELGRGISADSLEPAEALRLLRGGCRGVFGEVGRSADSEVGLVAFGAAEVWAT